MRLTILETTKENISDLEGMPVETTQNEIHRERKNTREKWTSVTCGTIYQTFYHTCDYSGVPL